MVGAPQLPLRVSSRFPSRHCIQPGDPLRLSLGDEWIITSPWEGNSFTALSDSDIMRIRVAHKGDPKVLANPNLVKRDRLQPYFGAEQSKLCARLCPLTTYIADKSIRLGFSAGSGQVGHRMTGARGCRTLSEGFGGALCAALLGRRASSSSNPSTLPTTIKSTSTFP